MTPENTILVLCAASAACDAITRQIADLAPTRAAQSLAGAAAELQGPAPTILVAVEPLPDGDALDILLTCTARGTALLFARPGPTPDAAPAATILRPGPQRPLRELVALALRSPDATPEQELARILQGVARARHDINNPLTAALAETQLLLMDARDAQLRESLEVIESQLRRIRDIAQESLAPPPALGSSG